MSLSPELRARFESLVNENNVVVFMKGNRSFPQCGFSATVVQILDEYLPEYQTVNVLEDPEVRQGIKDFSDWPTIPQLYVKGEFVGGCDIVRDMYSSGELEETLGTGAIETVTPTVTLSASAIAAFKDAEQDQEYPHLRLEINAAFQHGLSFGPELPKDIVVDAGGYKLRMDRGTARRADGLSIDFVEGPGGAGFKIDNPNEPARVQSMSAAELKARLDGDGKVWLFDVRTLEEREIAKIDGAVLLDEAGFKELEALPKDTEVIFHCHHGSRSQAAAQRVLGLGFTKVYNLVGGIAAYADVDDSIARY